MTYSEFKSKVLKVKGPRKTTITNSYGVYDAFKYYRKNKPKDSKYILTESQYFKIIRSINNYLVDQLVEGNEVVFPERMGRLEIRKADTSPRIDKDGNFVHNSLIDWDATTRLWYEDEESYRDKTLLKKEYSTFFRIIYNKCKAVYINQSFYKFTTNRTLRKRLSEQIKLNKIDAFALAKNK